MASPRFLIPRRSSAFHFHARQFQQRQRRHVSSTTTPVSPASDGLFKPPGSIIKPWKALTGAREWQTSTYTWNKNTNTNMPAVTATVDKLLRDYATMEEDRGFAGGRDSRMARNAIAERRKNTAKVHISGARVKDYGDRVVVDAFVFDGKEALKNETLERSELAKKRSAARQLATKKRFAASRASAGPGQPRPAGRTFTAPGSAAGFRPRSPNSGFVSRRPLGQAGPTTIGNPPGGSGSGVTSGTAYRSLKLDFSSKS